MITYHRPLRSNMEACCHHAANRTSRKDPLTRTEIIANLRRSTIKENALEDQKRRMFPPKINVRIANVRKFKGGYKIVGVKDLLDLTHNELKASLKRWGFTGFRWSGKIVSL